MAGLLDRMGDRSRPTTYTSSPKSAQQIANRVSKLGTAPKLATPQPIKPTPAPTATPKPTDPAKSKWGDLYQPTAATGAATGAGMTEAQKQALLDKRYAGMNYRTPHQILRDAPFRNRGGSGGGGGGGGGGAGGGGKIPDETTMPVDPNKPQPNRPGPGGGGGGGGGGGAGGGTDGPETPSPLDAGPYEKMPWETNPGGMPDFSDRIDEVINKDSELMQQARTAGLQQANRRGLLNSSMAVQGSQAAVLDRAMDIAGTEVGQEYDAFQQGLGRRNEAFQRAQDRELQAKMAKWNLRSSDRNAAQAMVNSASASYQAQYNSIMANTNLDAAARDKQLKAALAMRDRQMNLVEQLYNINLKW